MNRIAIFAENVIKVASEFGNKHGSEVFVLAVFKQVIYRSFNAPINCMAHIVPIALCGDIFFRVHVYEF